MGVECTFSFLLKIIVSLHILELEVFSSLAGISLLLLPLENARRDFIWSFKVLYKHQCLKYLYSYLQSEFFKKLPAISLKLEFNLRVKCAPKPWLCSVWFCQICMELCGSCIFFQPKKTICVQKWSLIRVHWVKFKLYLSGAVFRVAHIDFCNVENLTTLHN